MAKKMGAVMLLPTVAPSFAYCGNWEETSVGKSYCGGPRCGIAWYYDSNNYQKIHYSHECVTSDNRRYTETKVVRKKIGCCE